MDVATCDKDIVSLLDTQSSFAKILLLICTTAFGFVLIWGHEATEEVLLCLLHFGDSNH